MNTALQKTSRPLSALDVCAVIVLAVCIFFLGVGALTYGCPWGDDFAAYILQGISISDGTFDEQIKLNYIIHPSFMPDEATDGTLVYVWGYSLILALVYRLVGFDRLGYSSVIYYKLPSVIALALLAVVLYLFLRRRFGFRLSFFLSLLFCVSTDFYIFLDTMYSDLVFLFFALLAVYLFELYLDASGRWRLALAFVSGTALWFMYEVRLNGVAVLFACILSHLIWLYRQGRQKLLVNKKALLFELLPYIAFLALKFVSEAVLAPATSNASDLAGTNFGTIYGNVVHYMGMIKDWYSSMWSNVFNTLMALGLTPQNSLIFYYSLNVLSYGSMFLCAVGIVFDGFKRNFHYTVFLGGYLFVASMLFYNQGLRYIYPLLPILMMFTGYGFMRVVKLVSLPEKVKKAGNFLIAAVLAVVCVMLVYPRYLQNMEIQRKQGPDAAYASAAVSAQHNAYSSSALEMYDYINNNVPEDSVVGFFKPRALYLNTHRRSLALSSLLNNSQDDVDYYLIFKHMILDPQPREDFVTIWENPDFILMEKQTG